MNSTWTRRSQDAASHAAACWRRRALILVALVLAAVGGWATWKIKRIEHRHRPSEESWAAASMSSAARSSRGPSCSDAIRC